MAAPYARRHRIPDSALTSDHPRTLRNTKEFRIHVQTVSATVHGGAATPVQNDLQPVTELTRLPAAALLTYLVNCGEPAA
jgi:hypothetical protein